MSFSRCYIRALSLDCGFDIEISDNLQVINEYNEETIFMHLTSNMIMDIIPMREFSFSFNFTHEILLLYQNFNLIKSLIIKVFRY